MKDSIYIEFKRSDVSLKDVLDIAAVLMNNHPNEEIFLDGDVYGIIGRDRP